MLPDGLNRALPVTHVLRKIWMAADRHGSIGKDVMLMVSDGQGEPYSVLKPFKLTAAGWVSSGKGTPLAVTPVLWKPYIPRKR